MTTLFGRPGSLTRDCSEVTNSRLRSLIATRNVGPFRATGLVSLLDDLESIFQKVRQEKPEVYAAVKTQGMLCCRAIRRTDGTLGTAFSNHSWGCAMDVQFGAEIDPRGDGRCQEGLLELYPYFHEKRWYWGAGYSGRLEDAMHFEASQELLQERYGAGQAPVTPAASNGMAADRLRSTYFAGRSDFAAIARGASALSRSGERSETCGLLQDALNHLAQRWPERYAACAVDTAGGTHRGIFGGKTETAVKAFQKEHNRQESGLVDAGTLGLLDDALQVEAAPILRHPLLAGHPVLQAMADGRLWIGKRADNAEQDGVREI
ncbi:MAG TPA: M15 family metallopeptidase, partial [Prosthecobacter sp.]|nr:M15 family metallopeptidase [Prosthecobacter sp.]